MATFNKNISVQTVSGYLNRVKSLNPSTRKFIKNCAEGKSDVNLFKSCIGMATKSIDTMYIMVGIIILGVKNRSSAEDVKNCLRTAKLTLTKFVNLLYSGDGQKISAYLDSPSGSWFNTLVGQLLPAEDKILEIFYKKIKSMRMVSKAKRTLFSNSLNKLRSLILAACPGVPIKEDELYQGESNRDNRLENDELKVLQELAKMRNEYGYKIAAAYRHRIVFNVYRGDFGPGRDAMINAIKNNEDLVVLSGENAGSNRYDPSQGALLYSKTTFANLMARQRKYDGANDAEKRALYGDFAKDSNPIRFICLKAGPLNHNDIAQEIFDWFCKFPHTLVSSKKAVKSIQEESSGVRWKREVGHKEKSSDQQGFVIGNSRQGSPNLSPRGQEVIKLLGSAPDLLLREFASREEAMKEGYKEAELPGNASADGMVFYKPSDDGKKHIAIVWLYFDVSPQAVASSVREVLKNPRTVS